MSIPYPRQAWPTWHLEVSEIQAIPICQDSLKKPVTKVGKSSSSLSGCGQGGARSAVSGGR